MRGMTDPIDIDDRGDNGDGEPAVLISPRKDARFCARVLALGGMPRAVVEGGRVRWVGPDGQSWRENKTETKRRRA